MGFSFLSRREAAEYLAQAVGAMPVPAPTPVAVPSFVLRGLMKRNPSHPTLVALRATNPTHPVFSEETAA